MFRKLLYVLSLISLLGFTMHKYYVSIAEVDYNETEKLFEISIKFIGHDLESALENAGVPNLHLGTEKESSEADRYLLAYIKDRFLLKMDDAKVDYHFVGKEVNDDDFIYCYLTTSEVDLPKTITIENNLLVEKFDLQSNIVYMKIRGQQYNSTLNGDHNIEKHQIKN